MKKIICAFLAVFMSLSSAHALRSTKIEAYTDPDFLDYKIRTAVLFVQTDDFETRKAIEKTFVDRMAKYGVTVNLEAQLFPPTREWSAAERHAQYTKQGISAGIIISLNRRSSQITPSGMSTYYSNSSSQSYISKSAKSRASFGAIVFDTKTYKTVWTGEIFVKASGTWVVGAKKDARAAAKKIIKDLAEKGHLETTK